MTAHLGANPFLINDAGYDNTDGHAHLNQLANIVRELLGGADETEFTISSGGLLTPTVAAVRLLPFSGTSDNLDNIALTDMPNGRWLGLRPSSSGHTLTVRNQRGGDGEIRLMNSADFVMTSTHHFLLLQRRTGGSIWTESFRCYGDDMAAYRAFIGAGPATLTAAGIVELATTAELLAGTDADRAASPLQLAGLYGSNGNGEYLRYPGKRCLQWGSTNGSGSADVTVTFPLEWANTSYRLFTSASSNGSLRSANWHTKTTTNFQLSTWTAGNARSTATVDWWAIGTLL